jgi:hypothetical protein
MSGEAKFKATLGKAAAKLREARRLLAQAERWPVDEDVLDLHRELRGWSCSARRATARGVDSTRGRASYGSTSTATSASPMTDSLRCVECGREQADDERGWRSYLTTDEEEPAEALVYCPDCAASEFGSDNGDAAPET